MIDSTVEFISPSQPGSLRVCNAAVSRRGAAGRAARAAAPTAPAAPAGASGDGPGRGGAVPVHDVIKRRRARCGGWCGLGVGLGGCSGARRGWKGSGPVAAVGPAHLAPGAGGGACRGEPARSASSGRRSSEGLSSSCPGALVELPSQRPRRSR